jgi:hypothetical protein
LRIESASRLSCASPQAHFLALPPLCASDVAASAPCQASAPRFYNASLRFIRSRRSQPPLVPSLILFPLIGTRYSFIVVGLLRFHHLGEKKKKKQGEVCERRVDLLVCSLPLHRHSYIGFILAFASSIHNKQRVCSASDFVLVSRLQLVQRYRAFGHFLSAASSSRLKTMVGGSLVKASTIRFGLGVSGVTIVSGSRMPHHTYGCVVNSPYNYTCGARSVNVRCGFFLGDFFFLLQC